MNAFSFNWDLIDLDLSLFKYESPAFSFKGHMFTLQIEKGATSFGCYHSIKTSLRVHYRFDLIMDNQVVKTSDPPLVCDMRDVFISRWGHPEWIDPEAINLNENVLKIEIWESEYDFAWDLKDIDVSLERVESPIFLIKDVEFWLLLQKGENDENGKYGCFLYISTHFPGEIRFRFDVLSRSIARFHSKRQLSFSHAAASFIVEMDGE
jgi:hypothetical protein